MSDYLPFDIQIEILNRLPVKSLLQFRNVSKKWKSCIDSLKFIYGYAARHTDAGLFNLTYDQGFQGFMLTADINLTLTPLETNLNLSCLTPIGTSEGVWCFSYCSSMMLVLWNPSIRKSVGVFVPFSQTQQEPNKIAFGFGVRPDTLDPTIVKISYPSSGQGGWCVSVFSLSLLSWKQVDSSALPSATIRLKRYSQGLVRGYVFWAANQKFVGDYGILYKKYMLISFDLINHNFQLLDMPEEIRTMSPFPVFFSNLGNSLVISGMVDAGDVQLSCAWVLEADGGSITSCTLLFSIPSPHMVKLLGFSNDAFPIVEVARGNHMSHGLQVYEQITALYHDLGFEGNGGSFYIGPYKESLILLNHIDRSKY